MDGRCTGIACGATVPVVHFATATNRGEEKKDIGGPDVRDVRPLLFVLAVRFEVLILQVDRYELGMFAASRWPKASLLARDQMAPELKVRRLGLFDHIAAIGEITVDTQNALGAVPRQRKRYGNVQNTQFSAPDGDRPDLSI